MKNHSSVAEICEALAGYYQMKWKINYMAKNEKTSSKVSTIASKGLKDPGSLTKKEIQKISGSVLTQAPDKSKKGR